VRVRLPELTLCCVDTREPALALWAIARCTARIDVAEALLFTRAASVPSPPPGVRVIDVQVDTIEAYSEFMLHGLADHVRSSHALIVQWDGFVRDASRWDRDFLSYDYIGAPWRDAASGREVGNGGFSLRSRRLLLALRDPDVRMTHPEDEAICLVNRDLLEQRHGIRIAPLEVARRFAYERVAPAQPTFGFHGLFNFADVLAPGALESLLRTLPPGMCRGLDAHDLAVELLRRRMPAAAGIIIDKRTQLGMNDRRSWRLRLRRRLVQWRQSAGFKS